MPVQRRYRLGSEFPLEGFVQAAIERHFRVCGFDVDTSGHVDLLCSHPDGVERWHIEAKGKTSQPGLDFQTCLGQLLQRMRDSDTHYGIALPDTPLYVRQVATVSTWVVNALHIHWLLVSRDGAVRMTNPAGCTARAAVHPDA